MPLEVLMHHKSATPESSRTVALRHALHAPDLAVRRRLLQELLAAREPDDVTAVPVLLRALAARLQPEDLLVEALRALQLRRVATLAEHHVDGLRAAALAGHSPSAEELVELPELD
jgi:hypothetical protein